MITGKESITIDQFKTVLQSAGNGSDIIKQHNTDPASHNDIRSEVTQARNVADTAKSLADEAKALAGEKVTTDKIVDGAVTKQKLSSDISFDIKQGSITIDKLAPDTIEQLKDNSRGSLSSGNLNTIEASGVYSVNAGRNWPNIQNAPSNAYGWGVLIVFRDFANSVAQIYLPHKAGNEGGIFYRVKHSGDWKAWSKVFVGGGGGSSTDTTSSSLTPFRVLITKSPTPNTSDNCNTATIGTWKNLGNWQIATCYSCQDITIGGMYNDDIIYINGFESSGTMGSQEEYISTPPIVIKRKDGATIQNWQPDYFTSNITGYLDSMKGYYLGNVFSAHYSGNINGQRHNFLKFSILNAITDNGEIMTETKGRKIPIDNASFNFSWCKESVLATQ